MTQNRPPYVRIDISPGSWLADLPHGRRSSYVRAIVDDHLNVLRAARDALARSRTIEEIADLVAAAELPARLAAETDLATLDLGAREHVYALAAEVEATGLSPAELLAALPEAHI